MLKTKCLEGISALYMSVLDAEVIACTLEIKLVQLMRGYKNYAKG